MINEFNEIIEDKELTEIMDRIQKLTPDKIDLLWYNCGWIDSEKSNNNRAFSLEKMDQLKTDKNKLKQYTISLLLETPKREFLKNLFSVEQP